MQVAFAFKAATNIVAAKHMKRERERERERQHIAVAATATATRQRVGLLTAYRLCRMQHAALATAANLRQPERNN